jgi:lipoprotein-anchoring transpeptidase ErfK/SrfK
MRNPFASPRALKLIPLYRIFPFFVLSAWLAACAGQPAFLASDVAVQAHPQSWAQAEIAKPTHTPSPTPTPTFTPSPTEIASPTSTPGTIYAEIVPDTPAPEYASQAYTRGQSVSVASSYGGSKYILISISEQHLYAYEGDTLVYSFVASTGMKNATRAGIFSVLDKIPNAYGATWNIWMPNWLGIYWAGSMENGIHALPILPNGAQLWAGFLGRPISYGCIVLGASEAQLLYDWADIGTPVEIRR